MPDELELVKDGAKVRCKLNSHETPATFEAAMSFVSGKKFRLMMAGRGKKQDLDLVKYEPHLTQHKTNPNKVYCQLTGITLLKVPIVLDKHVLGKRYKKALKEYEEKNAKIESKKKEKLESIKKRKLGVSREGFKKAKTRKGSEAGNDAVASETQAGGEQQKNVNVGSKKKTKKTSQTGKGSLDGTSALPKKKKKKRLKAAAA
eukprot:CAMPEP_0172693700 /NCGR_PEP_ID=MMETSP1074-20121228/26175_1 /TAXON_ID=2916 /ORGANISM="Ceratium fusus, Strain PA161109" /LENGTH=202 /DNA_ID=CAMNT_0013514113 /DNA_START=105 /DNA_END=713 /DNA_ORIENTATION=+